MSDWLQQTRRRLVHRLRAMADQVGYTVGGVDPDELERLRQRNRQNAEWKARYDRVLDEWRYRLREGAYLNLIDDKRTHLIQSHAERRDVHNYYMLRDEVREWCDGTLSGMVYEIPLHSILPIGAIWFTDPLDAVAFKIRWY